MVRASLRRLLQSLGRQDDVVAFAFAQEQVFAEEQVAGGDGALEVRLADVVDVDAAAFDVLARLPFGRAQAGCGPASSTSGLPAPSSLPLSISLVGTSPTISLKVVSEMPASSPPKSISLARIASAVASGPWIKSVTALANALCAARAPAFSSAAFPARRSRPGRQESEVLQVADDVAVVGANPELVELIDAGPGRIEPDGAGDGLAELRAVGVGDERQGQAIDGPAELLAA